MQLCHRRPRCLPGPRYDIKRFVFLVAAPQIDKFRSGSFLNWVRLLYHCGQVAGHSGNTRQVEVWTGTLT